MNRASRRSLCSCGECPTYNECMRESGELTFCRKGESPTCPFERKGCLCITCPVFAEAGGTGSYFCIRRP